MSQTVGFISIVVLKVCDDQSPTLEEPMVKCEKLGAVSHVDAEGSKFSVSIASKSNLKVGLPKQIVYQSVSPLVEGQCYKVKDV